MNTDKKQFLPHQAAQKNIPRKWGEKPYHSLDYTLRQRFGEKVYKVTLNGGMTCPNRDGTLGRGGCIFCSGGGSGDFAADRDLSITKQIDSQIRLLEGKRPIQKYIAYFQAYTNTYGELSYLRRIFTEAISHPRIVALSIGTRPDCLGEEVLSLLEELNRRKPVWIELGLQTIHEDTARYIRRGYALPCFEKAVQELSHRGIEIIVHTILGLPTETKTHMLQTMDYISRQPVQGIKLQLLHILKGTDLVADYEAGLVPVLSLEDYLDTVIACLEHLSPELTIHRITGDGPRELLLAPLWSRRKREVLNRLHHELKARNTWQGRCFLEI